MSVGSATHIRGTTINVVAKNMPKGAFLMGAVGANQQKITDSNAQTQTITLNIENQGSADYSSDGGAYYPNQNGCSYGTTFYLCIPKDVAQALDASKTKLNIEFSSTMNVDRYEAYLAYPTDGSNAQNTALIEPAVLAAKCNWQLVTNPTDTDPQLTTLKVIKKEDGTGALL